MGAGGRSEGMYVGCGVSCPGFSFAGGGFEAIFPKYQILQIPTCLGGGAGIVLFVHLTFPQSPFCKSDFSQKSFCVNLTFPQNPFYKYDFSQQSLGTVIFLRRKLFFNFFHRLVFFEIFAPSKNCSRQRENCDDRTNERTNRKKVSAALRVNEI